MANYGSLKGATLVGGSIDGGIWGTCSAMRAVLRLGSSKDSQHQWETCVASGSPNVGRRVGVEVLQCLMPGKSEVGNSEVPGPQKYVTYSPKTTKNSLKGHWFT